MRSIQERERGLPEVRRAIVTGGSRGIGRCIAETLAGDGCDVAVLDCHLDQEIDDVAQAVHAAGRRWLSFYADVRNAAQIADVVESVVSHWGGVDILVNNAGIARDQVIWKMTDEQWGDVLATNLTGMFHCCRAALPAMRRDGWGAIVNISSINGLRGKFGQTNYSAAKAGVIGFTKALAKETAKFNITANAVAPGFIETAITQSMPQEARKEAVDEILLGRPGKVEDVAETVAFLCSDRARFITGEVIRVDGGQYI
jgi:3-oxoacyl-[acyl-carrier protein] reductase